MAKYPIVNQTSKNPPVSNRGRRGLIPIPRKSVFTQYQWFELYRKDKSTLNLELFVVNKHGKREVIQTLKVH